MLSERCLPLDAVKRCRRKDASLAAVGKMLPADTSLDATGKMSSERCNQKDAIGKASSLDAIGKVPFLRCN